MLYLKDFDVELAIKYTPDFRYHFEIEYIGNNIGQEDEIKTYLKSVCVKLGIVPLEEKELAKKIREIKKRLNFC